MTLHRYQIRFTKTGLLRWISHRDLARLWERMVRRAGVRLAMSEGFHRRPKISFPTALALGIESQDEVVELELVESPSAEQLRQRLETDSVDGLSLTDVYQLPADCGKAQFKAAHYRLTTPADQPLDAVQIGARIKRLWEVDLLTFQRHDKQITASAREQIQQLVVRDGQLEMTLLASRTASLRPTDVLDAVELSGILESGARLIRIRTELDGEAPARAAPQGRPADSF